MMFSSLPRITRLLALISACLMSASSEAADRAVRKLDEQVLRASVLFEQLQSEPARAIPKEILAEAKGLLILRETKAGFIVGARTGSGVVLFKEEGRWGLPRFVSASEGSLGLQAGWQKATFFHVLMTDSAVKSLRAENFRFGVGLRVTSGPRTIGDEAKTQSAGSDILVYSDTGGLFGGLAVEAGTLVFDQRANRTYYGYAFGPVEPVNTAALPVPARELVALVARLAGGASALR